MISNSNSRNWPRQIPCPIIKIGLAAGFFVVLLGMSGLTWQTLTVLAAQTPSTEFVIEVVNDRGDELSYLNHTASGDIHVPPNQPVTFSVSNLYGGVAPSLGHTNIIWVETDSLGVYEGRCTEFCEIQHARMSFGEEISSMGREHLCRPAVVPTGSEAADNL
ncbi:MAG: hypothetical protein L6R45_35190 [Anaerolineae bacterium]|nr:hypothetical protein [Anaerolineae bacterium]